MIEIRREEMRNAATLRNAYDSIYHGQGINLGDSFYLWLIGLLKPNRGRLLVDISCGEGRLVALARQQGLRAIGTDFSMAALTKGKLNDPSSGFILADGECLPFPTACADYITHIGSLEHYLHPQLGAAEIARLLKVGGRACVLLPNAFGLLGNIPYVLRHGEVFDDGQPLQRYATHQTWCRLLQKAGLAVERVVGYNEMQRPRTCADARALLAHPRKWLRALMLPLIPLNLSNHLVFLCRREAE